MKVYITKFGNVSAITYAYRATSDLSFKFHLLSEVGEPWQRDAKRLRNLLAISCAAKIETVELEQAPWLVDAIVEDVHDCGAINLRERLVMKHIQPWSRPRHYSGQQWFHWYVTIGQRRGSDSVERSNFKVFLSRLNELPTITVDNTNNCPAYYGQAQLDPHKCVPSIQVVHETHFLCGWVEWIAIHETNTAALELADEMLASLESYPVLDELDQSNLVYEEICDYWKSSSMRSRIEICKKSQTSVFAARRDHPEREVFNQLREGWE